MSDMIEGLNKRFKRDDLIMVGSEAKTDTPNIGYSTGSPSLDLSLGHLHGLPGGRISVIWGLPESGKTTLSLNTIARLHANNPEAYAAYIDLENGLELDWAARVGVDLDRLYIAWPEMGEEAFGVAEALIRSGAVHIVVVDSVPALSPRAEMEGEIGDAHVGLNPRLTSQFLRKTAFAIRKSGVAVVFINQVRTRIAKFASGLDEPGGFALKHHRSVTVFLKNDGPVELSGERVGNRIAYTVQKNRVADPNSIKATAGVFEIWADRGICYEADLVAQGLEKGILVRKGSWIGWKEGDNLGQGLAQSVVYLTENKDEAKRLEEVLWNGCE